MEQPTAQPPYAAPQFIVMPVPERNGLGVFAFFVALIGIFIPTGVVSLLGLVLGLAAIGRAPRGFATMGVVLGLLGTVLWLVIMLGVLIVGLLAALVGAVFTVGAFVVTQPEVVEVTSDMINVVTAAEAYQQEHDRSPDDVAALGLGIAATTDPWGGAYVLVATGAGLDVISGGPDGVFDTSDDVQLSRLDRVWEDAIDRFDERMEEFGERLEHAGDFQHAPASAHARYGRSVPERAAEYIRAAELRLQARDGAGSGGCDR